jgi:two-component system, chemotaxis family, CheB/CheR fusion protein
MPEPERDPELEALLEHIREERGFDFTGYKRSSLSRRIQRQMQDGRIESYAAYRDYLEQHQDEFVRLFNTILINVTSFFRDDFAWDYLRTEIIPKILERKDESAQIRIWSTGCASGEEAFTLAMVFAEALGEKEFHRGVKIYATDIDEEALTEGRHARYSAEAVEPVPEQLREKYFERQDSDFVFRADLRRSVIFGRHDLLQDPPISKIDLLVSRNTLMYFNAEAQNHILRQFNFALVDDGFLFLGKSETIANRSGLFETVDLRRRVFTRLPLEAAPMRRAAKGVDDGDLVRLADEALMRQAGFESTPLAQIVIDKDGELALANQQARMYFGLDANDLGRPIQDLEVSYRPVELRSQIQQAYIEKHSITLRDVEWRVGEEVRFVDVQIIPLVAETGEAVGCGISFGDVTRYHRLQQALAESKRDAETASEELQSTVEELETTNEELQSTNEELETTNEELHSTNEELETMNEELQSTNEELSTINDELQQRTDELNVTNVFLESILGSLGSAVIVLDHKLAIATWNREAKDLWGLAEDEVKGSHFLNLDIGLPVDQLRAPIRDVLAGKSEDGDVVLAAVDRRGKSIQTRVKVSPLGRTRDGHVGGAILMMEPTPAEP